MSDNCNHAVGTDVIEYYREIMHVDSEVEYCPQYSFDPFKFCPYCGVNVSEEASIFQGRIDDYWTEFRKKYPAS